MKRKEKAGPSFLGIDCGGTRSIAVYVTGGLTRRVEAGAGNVRLLSDAQLTALFRTLSSAHRDLPRPDAVAIGMAGAGNEEQRERIRRVAARIWPRAKCVAAGDLEMALAAAEGGDGIGENGLAALVVVLSGTGSVFYGKNERGQCVRVGGWGHLVGDKGSAYEIGLRALKAVLFYYDRDGKVPPLGRRLLAALLLNEVGDLPEWALAASKTDIAALSQEISKAASHGDSIARDILDGAAHSIAKDAVTCAGRLARRGQRVKFVLTGSVLLNQPVFCRRVAKFIRDGWKHAAVAPLKNEAALGALELARRLISSKDQGPKFEGTPPSTPDSRLSTCLEHWTSGLGLSSSPTEQRNPRSSTLDRLSLGRAIALMLREDEGIPAAIRAERRKIERAIKLIVRSFKSGGRLFYVGAGTSGRLGVLDASECPPTFRTDPDMVQGVIAGGQTALWRAVEGAEDNPEAGARALESRGVSKRDTVVGIAAGGRTPFVWGALDAARRRGARTILLTFNPKLKIPREHRPTLVIAPNIGPEILTGSTRLKAGTATKLILNMFTTLAMVRMGKVLSNLMVDLKPANVKLRDRAVRIVQSLTRAGEENAKEALIRCHWIIPEAVALLS